MNSLLVAVKSCERDRKAGFHDAIRETWGRDLKQMGVQVMFFIGHSGGDYFMAHPKGVMNNLQRDEFIVNAPDDYMSLPFKTRGICQWAQPKMFSHLFLCDNDTLVNAKALKGLPYEAFDYAGHFKGGQAELGTTFYYKDHKKEYPNCHPWASGGIGYFLSKRATEIIVDAYPKDWAEDLYVGQVLGPQIQKGWLFGGALNIHKVATWHFQKTPKYPDFTPNLLRRAYKEGGFDGIYAS